MDLTKRVYDNEKIRDFYYKQRLFQNLEYVKRMHGWYRDKTKVIRNVWDVIMEMDNLVDVSDPDLSLGNVHHLFQTAEMMRRNGEPDWMQVTGLIHDLGKMMYLDGCDEDGTSIHTQWGVVGDTFVVGHPLPASTVYPEYNSMNLDEGKGSVYTAHCGINNTLCSWGHDEYMYKVLVDNGVPLSTNKEAMAMIRFHSLYPWHQCGAYRELMCDEDYILLKAVQRFQKYDLYSKENEEVDIKSLKKYYLPLLNKFVGKTLMF